MIVMKRILQTYLEKAQSNGLLFIVGNTDDVIKILDNIKPEYLYKSDFHGLYHSQKVCFFAYLIGKHENLSETEMKILLDAAIYHDMGRENDNEDNLHGYISARLIDQVVKYDNPTDMYYLKAIVDAHSKPDKFNAKAFNNWVLQQHDDDLMLNRISEEIKEEEFKKLCDILKDADALDRLRFRNGSAMLDEKYLRVDYSKNLIRLSKLINEYYLRHETEEKYIEAQKMYGEETYDKDICYHSIGFDLFKALSILKYGVLSSYRASKDGVSFTRNFYGNNSEFWISVVDAKSDSTNNEGYKRYVKNGISFLCYVNKLTPGVRRTKDNGSLEPRMSDEYHDEKFVFDKIPLEHIQFISIPREYMSKSILELNYLYCNSNYETVYNNVNNYLNEIENFCDIKINRSVFENILTKYKETQLNFNSENYQSKLTWSEYLKLLNNLKSELNLHIQEWMQLGFAELLGKTANEKITLAEVMKYILNSNNIEYDVIDRKQDEGDDSSFISFPFYHDSDSFLLRLSTFDLNKSISEEDRER